MTQATGDAEKLIKLMTNSSVDNCDQIDVGVATQVELQRVKNKPLEIIKFRNGAKKFMIEMGKKWHIVLLCNTSLYKRYLVIS